jgi:hypothetical protein
LVKIENPKYPKNSKNSKNKKIKKIEKWTPSNVQASEMFQKGENNVS